MYQGEKGRQLYNTIHCFAYVENTLWVSKLQNPRLALVFTGFLYPSVGMAIYFKYIFNGRLKMNCIINCIHVFYRLSRREEIEERQANYERYRTLVENECAGGIISYTVFYRGDTKIYWVHEKKLYWARRSRAQYNYFSWTQYIFVSPL